MTQYSTHKLVNGDIAPAIGVFPVQSPSFGAEGISISGDLIRELRQKNLDDACRQGPIEVMHVILQELFDRGEELTEKISRLTARQIEIMLGVIGGEQNKSIAFNLGIKAKTVEAHRKELMKTLDVDSAPKLGLLAFVAAVLHSRELPSLEFAASPSSEILEIVNPYRERVNEFQERLATLTRRQNQVLCHVIQGKTFGKIADQLGIDIKTVEAHASDIRQKMVYEKSIQLALMVAVVAEREAKFQGVCRGLTHMFGNISTPRTEEDRRKLEVVGDVLSVNFPRLLSA